MNRNAYYLLLLLWALAGRVAAQSNELPYSTLSLQTLQDFQPAGAGWQLAGDVNYGLSEKDKSSVAKGTGILVYDPAAKAVEPLSTKLPFGDLLLEADFMVGKNARAVLLVQGRYGVLLADSWGATRSAADCGAIEARWNQQAARGFEGHPPAQNVSKAPGLWQHLKLVFRAPRFNEKGEKTANARFVEISLNGVVLHRNVEITGATRTALAQDEKPTAPLVLKPEQGGLALRNIRYKSYSNELVTLTKLRLSTYDVKEKAGQAEGTQTRKRELDIQSADELNALTPKREMEIDALGHLAPGSRDDFAGKITGTIHIPYSGQYLFDLSLRWIPSEVNLELRNGGGELKIAGKKILNVRTEDGGRKTAAVQLEAGDYPLELSYFKRFKLWYAPSNDILLAVEGPGVAYTALSPVIKAEDPVTQMNVLAKNEPVMQRGFIQHRGRKHTHTISVGEPSQVNYSVDLSTGEFLQFWRGNFLETTPMWYGRGETQLSVPLGSVVELAGKPSLAVLTDQNAAWPDSNATYNNLGYDVDKAGRPIFKYTLGSAQVRESFAATDEGRRLTHSFTVTSSQPSTVWCRLATGSDIVELPGGLYAINDKQYFIQLSGNEKPLLRNASPNTKELLLPVKVTATTATLSYSIVW